MPHPRIEHPDNQLKLPHKFIALTQGQYAKVDAELFDQLNGVLWRALQHDQRFYAGRTVSREGGQQLVYLHRYVWQLLNGPIPKNYTIDHRNHDGLDNRSVNLRLATTAQQNQNQRRRACNTSGFIGVSSFNRGRRWRAEYRLNGEQVYLGRFDSPVDAAKARDLAAWIEHGEFAVLNFPGLLAPNE